MGDREEVISNFTRWNYGGLTQASEKEDEAGYTEFGDDVRCTFLLYTFPLSLISLFILYSTIFFFLIRFSLFPSSPLLFNVKFPLLFNFDLLFVQGDQ